MIKILTEFIGTFVFLAVILTTGQALPIGLALAAAIYFGGNVSGGHFNPAVSTMMLAKGGIRVETWIAYVIAQILGGLAALLWYRASVGKGKGK
jgi:aquaporin Z